MPNKHCEFKAVYNRIILEYYMMFIQFTVGEILSVSIEFV